MIDLTFALVLVLLGLVGGAMSGLLGIGGGLVIIPLLLYVPEWLGIGTVEIRSASAIAVVQVAAATISGTIAHGRRGFVRARLALIMSLGSASGALIGGIISASVPSVALLIATALLASGAAGLMLLPVPASHGKGSSDPAFSGYVAIAIGALVGLLIGMNGAGAFLMAPAMIYLLRIPTREALATVLAIGFPTALAALTGKVVTGQVPLLMSAMVVLGAVPGAQIGSMVSVRTSARVLRLLYGALVLVLAVGLWYDVFNVQDPSAQR